MKSVHWKHVVLGVMVFGHLASGSFAQSPAAAGAGSARPARGAYGFAATLERRVGLTPEQRDAVRGLLAEQRQKSQALRDETDQKIRAMLSAEQQKKFDALLAEQRSRRASRK